MVFSGHAHHYERTKPITITNDIITTGTGPIYVITGGGGAGLTKFCEPRHLKL